MHYFLDEELKGEIIALTENAARRHRYRGILKSIRPTVSPRYPSTVAPRAEMLQHIYTCRFNHAREEPVIMSAATIDRPLRAVLITGLVAGTLDITDAFVFSYLYRGVSPVRVLQSVAFGALGARSYSMGLLSATLGLFFHFLIALTATTLFYLASRRLSILLRHPFAFGALYGLTVYVFMYYVVMPLSKIGRTPTVTPVSLINQLSIHILGVGITIAYLLSRLLRPSPASYTS
jgi:hypothetical protein